MKPLDYSDPSTFYPTSIPVTADGVEFKLGMTIFISHHPFEQVTSEELHAVEDTSDDPRIRGHWLVRKDDETGFARIPLTSIYSSLTALLDAMVEQRKRNITGLYEKIADENKVIKLLKHWRRTQNVLSCPDREALEIVESE